LRVARSGLRARRVDCCGAESTLRRDDHSERYWLMVSLISSWLELTFWLL
jgi:hypothetical protein